MFAYVLVSLPVDLHWFFEISIRTEFLSQFEMNAEMEISKTSGDQQGVYRAISGSIIYTRAVAMIGMVFLRLG